MSLYKDRVAQGVCGKCGKAPVVPEKAMCPDCGEKERLRAEKRRENSKASGLCSSCGSRPKVPGKSKCEICGAGNAASARRKAAQRKRDGLCPSCGNPAMPGKVVCEECSKRMTVVATERYYANVAAGKCGYCGADPAPGSKMCQYHIDQTAESRENLKREVMNAYGGCKCSWCSETDIRYLEIDHIDGGGRQHTEEIKRSGHSFYQWLKQQNFPAGFRVLCRPCNNKAHTEKCREADKRLTEKHGT